MYSRPAYNIVCPDSQFPFDALAETPFTEQPDNFAPLRDLELASKVKTQRRT
jgi:hypothetical protein